MKSINAVAVCTILACSTALAANSNPAAFQGLSWGASEAQVKAKFPAAKPRDCSPQERRMDVSPVHFCGTPTLSGYEVAGIPFRLTLGLRKKDRTLGDVTLWHESRYPAETAAEQRKLSFAQFDRLRSLLSEKYGRPADLSRADDRYWTRYSVWETATTNIEMSMSGWETDYHIQIWYKPLAAVPRESDKL